MNYSDYWRVNKSSFDYLELASAIRAIRKIVGHLGVNVEVAWVGMPTNGDQRIELPAQLAQKSYPIPGEIMDVLVGLAIHNALHVKENSLLVRGRVHQIFSSLKDKTNLRQFVDACEDIHVDGVATKAGAPGKYVQKARAWWWENARLDLTTGFPTMEKLLSLWGHIVLDNILPKMGLGALDELQEKVCLDPEEVDTELLVEAVCGDELSKWELYSILISMPIEYVEPLAILLGKTKEIIESDPVTRTLCYRELWTKLESTFIDWMIVLDEAMSLEEKQGMQSGEGSFNEEDLDELPPELVAAVEEALAREAEDITAMIEAALKSLGGNKDRFLLYPAVYENALEPCKSVADRELVKKLRSIFQTQRDEATRINRGLLSGKLDSRRLYRAYTTGGAFKLKEYFPEQNKWNIAILLDASGSMRSKWNFVNSICAALVEALGEYNDIEVYAYRENQNTCLLTKLYSGSHLCTVTPGGSTPTGEAIIATAIKMAKGSKRLILHVTDGLWNVGVDVWYALEFCQREKIEVVTFGCGSSVRAFEMQYRDNFEMMESLEQLPDVVESLLRRKLLRMK